MLIKTIRLVNCADDALLPMQFATFHAITQVARNEDGVGFVMYNPNKNFSATLLLEA